MGVPLWHGAARVAGGHGSYADRGIRLQLRGLGGQPECAHARHRAGPLQSHGIPLRVPRILNQVADRGGFGEAGPLHIRFRAGPGKDKAPEHGEQLVGTGADGDVVGLGVGLADAREHINGRRRVERAPGYRCGDGSRGTDAEPAIERRRPHGDDTADRATIVGAVAIEEIGFAQHARDPLCVESPDAGIDALTRLYERMRKALGVVAQHDGVVRARTPPEIFGGHAGGEPRHVDRDAALAGGGALPLLVAEPIWQVDRRRRRMERIGPDAPCGGAPLRVRNHLKGPVLRPGDLGGHDHAHAPHV